MNPTAHRPSTVHRRRSLLDDHLRMHKAARLLTETNLTVRDFAWRLGYRQPGQFAKAFRRHYGTSPSTYRHDG